MNEVDKLGSFWIQIFLSWIQIFSLEFRVSFLVSILNSATFELFLSAISFNSKNMPNPYIAIEIKNKKVDIDNQWCLRILKGWNVALCHLSEENTYYIIFHFLTKICQNLLQQPAASSGQTFSLVDQKNNPIKIKIQVSI